MYIKEKLKQLKFETITPIQEGVFNAFEKPNHLVGVAPTGTGKTHAYLLPILSHIDLNLPFCQALIIVPTNELVIQVETMLKQVETELRVKAYIASDDKKRQFDWLSKNQPHIVISTPSKLYDYFSAQALRISQVKFVVLDEADMMFDEDFLKMIDPILSATSKAKYLLFSATIKEEMQPFIKKYFGNYELIDTKRDHKLNIEYPLITLKVQTRINGLLKIISHLNPYLCFIFVSKKEDQSMVYQSLIGEGYQVANLSSNLNIKMRKNMMKDIIDMKYQYVVTSDLAARGLDFKISHVIHYDLPYQLEFFMHRSGRTGRMNDSGVAITIATLQDHRKIDKLKKSGIPFTPYQLTNEGLIKQEKKKSKTSEEELNAIKSIKKPTKVKPNYKKKNKEKVMKAKKEARRKVYAQNR